MLALVALIGSVFFLGYFAVQCDRQLQVNHTNCSAQPFTNIPFEGITINEIKCPETEQRPIHLDDSTIECNEYVAALRNTTNQLDNELGFVREEVQELREEVAHQNREIEFKDLVLEKIKHCKSATNYPVTKDSLMSACRAPKIVQLESRTGTRITFNQMLGSMLPADDSMQRFVIKQTEFHLEDYKLLMTVINRQRASLTFLEFQDSKFMQAGLNEVSFASVPYVELWDCDFESDQVKETLLEQNSKTTIVFVN